MRVVYHVVTSSKDKFNAFKDKVGSECVWREPSKLNKPLTVGSNVIFSILDEEYDNVTVQDILAGKVKAKAKKKGKTKGGKADGSS